MSDHRNSTAVPPSIGELTENVVRRAGEAMAARKVTDEQIADAMRSLEPQLHDMRHMARITADLVEQTLSKPDEVKGERLAFWMSSDERDTFMFAVNDIEDRILRFKLAYMDAYDGRQAK